MSDARPQSERLPILPLVEDPEVAGGLRWARWSWRRFARLALGVLCLLGGFLGLFLPFLQGILLLSLGAVLLSPDVPFLRRLVVRAFRRWPKLRRKVPRALRHVGRTDPRS